MVTDRRQQNISLYQVQSSATYDSILDPADLDLDEGYSEPDSYASPDLKFETLHMHC